MALTQPGSDCSVIKGLWLPLPSGGKWIKAGCVACKTGKIENENSGKFIGVKRHFSGPGHVHWFDSWDEVWVRIREGRFCTRVYCQMSLACSHCWTSSNFVKLKCNLYKTASSAFCDHCWHSMFFCIAFCHSWFELRFLLLCLTCTGHTASS